MPAVFDRSFDLPELLTQVYVHFSSPTHSQDDEGREVGIKIDRMDSKHYSSETATKAYIEVCALSLLSLLSPPSSPLPPLPSLLSPSSPPSSPLPLQAVPALGDTAEELECPGSHPPRIPGLPHLRRGQSKIATTHLTAWKVWKYSKLQWSCIQNL